jgi:hypothetical protein
MKSGRSLDPYPLVALALAQLTLTAILRQVDPVPFLRFFSDTEPLLVVAMAASLGTASVGWLRWRGWFTVDPAAERAWVFAGYAALAAGFALIMILFDVLVVFPADINVPPPLAFMFYPVMGYVVDCLFHALPLAILVAVLRLTPGPDPSPTGPIPHPRGSHIEAERAGSRSPAFLLIVVAVASIEPVFQAVAVPPAGFPSWARAFVTIHIFAFNLLQLVVFMRNGFLSMYGLRLVYYLCWHIAWGYVRLKLLF